MSNPTSNFGWQMPTATDLVTDLPADFEVFGQAVDTTLVDLKGGTSGQILAKNTNTDMDFVWITNDVGDITAVTAGTGISGGGTSGAVTITNDMATTITASGDIVVGTGSGTYDNLPIGTTGQILTADTTVSPYKVKWAAPAVPASGLTFISKTTFSAVTSASLPNSTFTSTYENYRVILTLDSGTATTVLSMRMRASGTDDTAANYFGGRQWIGYNGVPTQTTMNGLTSWGLDTIDNATQSRTTFVFDVIRPNLAVPTTMNLSGVSGSGSGLVTLGVFHNNTSPSDSLTFISGSGTVTGTYRVYGYQNS